MITGSNVAVLACANSSSDLPRVPDGEYLAVYDGHMGAAMFGGTRKLCVRFRLLAYPGLVLERWYRVQDYRGGRVRAGRSSDIARETSAILGRRVRLDRIPVTELAGKTVVVFVSTCTRDGRQRLLADVNRYSRIERVMGQPSA